MLQKFTEFVLLIKYNLRENMSRKTLEMLFKLHIKNTTLVLFESHLENFSLITYPLFSTAFKAYST